MTSAFNQVDFDQFIKTLSIGELQSLLMQDESLIGVVWDDDFQNRLAIDIYTIKEEMLHRYRSRLSAHLQIG